MISKLDNSTALFAVLGFTYVASASMAQDQSVEPTTTAISLVQVPARRIAFVEHIGPYWQLGRAIDETRARMASVHRESPLIIRYETDPGKTQPKLLKVEVGFVLQNGAKPSAPFLIRTEPASTSITLAINEPTVSPRTAYAQLKQWAIMHDLTPLGPMTELHFTIYGKGAATPVSKLEFHMPLVSKLSSTNTEESDAYPKASSRSISSAKAITTEPFQGFVDGGLAVIVEENKLTDLATSSETPASSSRSRPNALDVEADKIISVPDEANQYAPTTTQAIDGNKVLETAQAKARGSGEHLEQSSEAPPEASTDESIESLFAAGEYNKLALRLMPDRPTKSNTTIVWLGQLSFRISAAAKGIQDQYPGEAEPLLQLSQALRERHSQLASTRRLDTLKHSTVQVETGSETTRERLAQIMRRVDRLLAGIAFKQISPDDAIIEIVNILTQANDLLGATAQ